MSKRKLLPVALTIAGSDSGGGAGIQADLKTFAALGVHGASAIACLTAQNPKRVLGIETCSPKMLRRQLEAVFEELNPRSAKTGMLFSKTNILVVAEFFRNKKCPFIVDPILLSTSGAKLLEPAAIKILKEKLLPLAALVTPNLSEAEILSGQKISTIEDMSDVARKIHLQFGCAVLVKGGHLQFVKLSNRDLLKRKPVQRFNNSTIQQFQATDIFFDGKTEFILSAPFVKGIRTHGTGCVYSAAICAALALGKNLPQAVQIGKRFVTQTISGSYKIGKHFALATRGTG
ncbi:MAG: bifunctional hydroxymethylpyrimidine kinase/phosphomethylpyrimidine kinase [Limisphaerales bacterium]